MEGAKHIIPLSLNTCHMVFLSSQVECETTNQSRCITCPWHGEYLAGGNTGQTIVFILWLLTCVVGVFGVFGNILIIVILKKQKSTRSFDTFLIGLAAFDLASCFTSVICLTGNIFYLFDWSRGLASWIAYHYGLNLVMIAHSGSCFTTLLIALERFLVVSSLFGGKAVVFCDWFNKRRSQFCMTLVLLFALFMGIPRLTSFYVAKNDVGQNFPSLRNVDYFVKATHLANIWYVKAGAFHDVIDLWVPLPILLVLNAVLFYQVKKLNVKRKQLSVKHQHDLKTTRMFLPVVVALFVSNIGPIVHYAFLYTKHVYAEMFALAILSFGLNSAVNLFIYYTRASDFRSETQKLLSRYFPTLKERFSTSSQQSSASKDTKGDKSLPIQVPENYL